MKKTGCHHIYNECINDQLMVATLHCKTWRLFNRRVFKVLILREKRERRESIIIILRNTRRMIHGVAEEDWNQCSSGKRSIAASLRFLFYRRQINWQTNSQTKVLRCKPKSNMHINAALLRADLKGDVKILWFLFMVPKCIWRNSDQKARVQKSPGAYLWKDLKYFTQKYYPPKLNTGRFYDIHVHVYK